MTRKLIRKPSAPRMTMKARLSLGLGAIAVILLLSSIISVAEYRRMSNYVSDLIASDMKSMNTVQKLEEMCEAYNSGIFAATVDRDTVSLPQPDSIGFMTGINELKSSFSSPEALHVADTVMRSYLSYIRISREIDSLILSDTGDLHSWFSGSLIPAYRILVSGMESLDTIIYDSLKKNSETFEDGFYRGIMPGIVSVGIGLLLVILLLFFIISYYVNPVYRMLDGIDSYRRIGRRYACTFDGDDELAAINEGISEIVEENIEMKKRIARLREERDRLIEMHGQS